MWFSVPTPRGTSSRGTNVHRKAYYTLGYKNSNSKYYKSIHISYPNAANRAKAKQRGVRPGGDIMIHGQPNGKAWLTPFSQMINWTNGCIALTNDDMDIVWDAVRTKTPIEIRP